MKVTYEAHLAWVRHIAENIMNWDKENIVHLYDMLCEIHELLQIGSMQDTFCEMPIGRRLWICAE